MKTSKRSRTAEALPTTNWWMLAGAALLLSFLVYSPALRGPFLFDDLAMPSSRPGADQIPWTHWFSGNRPLLHLMMWAIRRAVGLNPFPYHLLNVLVHAANALLTLWIARKLLAMAGAAEATARWIALLCAGIFLLHPVQTEAVAYVASLSETISVLFAYSAFALYLAVRDRGASWGEAAAVAGLTGVGFLFKEHVAMLPLVMLLAELWWRAGPGFAAALKRNWRVWALFGAGAVGAAAMVIRVLGAATSLGFGVKGLTWPQYLVTEFRAFWVYARLYLLPLGQNIDHDYPIVKSLADPLAIFGLIALLAAAAAAWHWRSRAPLAGFGFFALLLMLAPTSTIIPIPDAVAERRLYFPFLGLLLMTAQVLLFWKPARGKQQAVFGVVLLALGGLTFRRSALYADPVAMWEDSIAVNPANSRAQFQLAYAYYQRGRCEEASGRYEKAAAMRAADYQILVDWALALDCAGKYEEAAQRLQHAVTLERSAHGYALLGMVRAKQGLAPPAEGAFEEAIRLDPNYDMTYAYRGNLYSTQGKYAAAAEDYRKALTLNSENPIAGKGLSQMEKALRPGVRPGS